MTLLRKRLCCCMLAFVLFSRPLAGQSMGTNPRPHWPSITVDAVLVLQLLFVP